MVGRRGARCSFQLRIVAAYHQGNHQTKRRLPESTSTSSSDPQTTIIVIGMTMMTMRRMMSLKSINQLIISRLIEQRRMRTLIRWSGESKKNSSQIDQSLITESNWERQPEAAKRPSLATHPPEAARTRLSPSQGRGIKRKSRALLMITCREVREKKVPISAIAANSICQKIRRNKISVKTDLLIFNRGNWIRSKLQ